MEPHRPSEVPTAGPNHCWKELIVRYRGHLRGRVRRTLWRAGVQPQPDTVEELTQDVYCRLLDRAERKLTAFRGQSDAEIVAYLCRAAERIVLDQLRAKRALKRGGHTVVVAANEDAEQIADRGGTPEDALIAAEDAQRLLERWEAVLANRKDPRALELLRLALRGGCNNHAMARILDVELANTNAGRLLRQLRRHLRRWAENTPVS